MKYKSLLLPILILVTVPPILASAPPSCQKAASSKNGNFLVMRDLQTEATADRSGGRKVQRVSFQVLTKTEFLNETERFTSAATYWGVRCGTWFLPGTTRAPYRHVRSHCFRTTGNF